MKTPHVIIISADQLRYDVLGKGFTPHIDALAQESISFDNAYCACPLCVPARGSLFTGRYPGTTGSLINPWEKADSSAGYVKEGTPNLYTLLEQNGWDCLHSGKQHLFTAKIPLEERPDSRTRWLATEKTYREYLRQNSKPMPGGPGFRSPVPESLSRKHTIYTTCSNANTGRYEPGEEYYFDSYFARAAVKGLQERDRSRPVFLSAMFLAPHPPFQIPAPWYSRYQTQDFTLPDNVGVWYPHQSPLQLYNVTGVLGSHYTRKEWQESWRVYLGLVSLLDHCVGQILTELKNQSIYDDCLILFTSDHGEMLGSHRLFQKMCMYQESVKVPLLLRLPRSASRCQHQVLQTDGMPVIPKSPAPQNQTCRHITQNVSHIDILPTLCHYLGLETPPGIEGTSLHHLIEDPRRSPACPVFIQYDGNSCLSGFQRCIIDGEHKLILDIFRQEAFFELYNIAADPEETTNLLFEQSHDSEGARLFPSLLEHMREISDPLDCDREVYNRFIRRIS